MAELLLGLPVEEQVEGHLRLERAREGSGLPARNTSEVAGIPV
jgi:hypothetical protein